MYYIALLLTVGANILYHISQKNISEKINPMFSLTVTYFVALILSLFGFFIVEHSTTFKGEFQHVNWASISLGISIILLELGFLLVYRTGWNIGNAAIISTVLVTIALIPIGILLYKERMNTLNILGILLCLLGLYFISRK
ncbi:MAG: EamA family transporter [Tissierellia bacterium]|nr:EamA family transporter [Tissierellia bacterium]